MALKLKSIDEQVPRDWASGSRANRPEFQRPGAAAKSGWGALLPQRNRRRQRPDSRLRNDGLIAVICSPREYNALGHFASWGGWVMGKQRNASTRVLGCAHLVIALVCAASFASPRSSQLIDAGVEQLEHGRPENALKSFTEATHDDPKDAEAAFFAGVALNHLGRAEE